jgi:endonuclease/exonuclease/phosphatase family metal-dependent hydrolase
MKTFFIALSLLAGQPDSLNVMFWNLENFFDYRNDSTSVSDAEFSSRGDRHWTKKRFYTKCNAIAKGILWASAKKGAFPDAVGVAEVENAFTLRRLLQATALRKLDYGVVHFESPDRRGIDVGLLYRKSRLRLLSAKPCHIFEADSTVMLTRDILLATFMGPGRDTLAIMVNHHPSKVGKGSDGRRELAMARLLALRDSLMAEGIRRIVAIGDFNDEVTPAPGVKPAYPKGAGTIKFQGRWEKIDGCPVLEGLEAREHIFAPPHLSTRDTRFSGQKPLRTFSGPRYLGGLSDHYPIVLEIREK